MPTSGEPRVTIRLSEVDHAVLNGAAEAAGVALGALIREAAMSYAREVAGDGASGSRRMRRRSASASSVDTPRSSPAGRQAKLRSHKTTAAAPPVASPRGARGRSASKGADGPAEWALERQRKLNRAKEKSG